MNAKSIRTLRLDMGLSQEAFAEKLNVSRYTVTAWEAGRKPGLLATRKLQHLEFEHAANLHLRKGYEKRTRLPSVSNNGPAEPENSGKLPDAGV